MMDKCIIVVGNLADGYKFVGPFDEFDEAALYADRNYNYTETWIATLHPYANLSHYATGTAEECEKKMLSLTNGERGCANPAEHES